MGPNLDSAPAYQGRAGADFYTSVDEAKADLGASGKPQDVQPTGTVAVAIEPGDTISALMRDMIPPLNWNDPQVRAQFREDNPQFAENAGKRNPDLIWPGEVVYLQSPLLAAAERFQEAQPSQGSSTQGFDDLGNGRQERMALSNLSEAIQAELAAGARPDDIKNALSQYTGLSADAIDHIVDPLAAPLEISR